MIKKVLIANRGEIATRVIRACQEMGIVTVAIYSEQDRTALHVKKADESYLVGPGPIQGYINAHKIVDLANRVGADAIHPGYGFLSENPKLPELCAKNGITFIGPSAETIDLAGNKSKAKAAAVRAGLPVVEGSVGNVESVEEAMGIAEKVGYPIMLKATSGGGGRGLRVCRSADELRNNYVAVISETKAAFGSTEVFLEKYIERPHHIEFQILADKFGNIVHLGERDCSIQRRHQKLIEIAPSVFLDEKLRAEMGAKAVAFAREVGYVNAGTVEFLVDAKRKYYFIEMNTRLQVEHTITEEVTGIDIVKHQIRIADNMPLEFEQSDIALRGFSIQCRINGEDPKNNFMPSKGRITAYYSPGGFGVRIDGAVYKDYTVTGFYDSLLAKLVVRAQRWDWAVARMQRALKEYQIKGLKTTTLMHLAITNHPDFLKGDFDTSFIDTHPEIFAYDETKDPYHTVLAIAASIIGYEGF